MGSDDPFERLRARIDEVDLQLVERLVERAELARQIGVLKRAAGQPVLDHGRECEILARIEAAAAGRVPAGALSAIYREILELTRAAVRETPEP